MSLETTRRSFVSGAFALVGASLAAAPLSALAAGVSASKDGETKASSAKASSSAKEPSAAKDAAAPDPDVDTTVYVPASWVKAVIDGEKPAVKDYVLLEVAWGTESDDKNYGAGHLPGAVHLNTDDIESDEFWNYRSPAEITDLCAKYGITQDTTVIVYGAKGTDSADDRAALLFLWAGVKSVKALDGGYEAWTKAGYDVETASNAPKASDAGFGIEIPGRPELVISIDEVKDKLANDPDFKLVSIRSYKEFTGETSGYSYIDLAGEPKGAIWGHDTDDGSYCNADGTTVGIDVLEGYLAESGKTLDDDTAFYCGTGWRAAIPTLICYQNGVAAKLYDGGWFQWQMDKDNDVQLGDPQKGDVQYVKVADLQPGKALKK